VFYAVLKYCWNARFFIVWLGQLISTVGTRMSRFALMVWAWEITHEALPLTLVAVFSTLPAIPLGMFVGALVDRWDRKRIMIWGDLIAGLSTVAVLLLYVSDRLDIWHLYAVAIIAGIAGTFQHLAYSTAITAMIPKAQYARASGMLSLSEYISVVAAPLLAGILVGIIGLAGILLIDTVTFLVAVCTLLVVHIPRPAPSGQDDKTGSFWKDAFFGFRYLLRRPSFIGLLIVFSAFLLAESLGYPLVAPMILARTGDNSNILGIVQAVMGLGGVIGGIILVAWGGPKRRVHGLFLGLLLTGLLGDALMGLGQTLLVWLIAGFCLEVFIPMMIGSDQAIWRAKVPPDIQGRVFAARDLIFNIVEPLGVVLGGLLVDKLLEPAMMPDGSLAPFFGGLVGTGPGAGMGLLIFICGILSALAGMSGYLFRSARDVETVIPDHDANAA
jgi:MFS transporter, DHA3 family, macrolide efflux protein